MKKRPLNANLLALIFLYVTTLFGPSLTSRVAIGGDSSNWLKNKEGFVLSVRANSKNSKKMVSVRYSDLEEAPLGTVLEVFRRRGLGSDIKVGELKLVSSLEDEGNCELIESQTEESGSLWQLDYPFVMAKDIIKIKLPKIISKVNLRPVKEASYKTLFQDPKSSPLTYQLSRSGKKHLKKLVEEFKNVQQSYLIIETHTDGFGNWSVNQLESIERAKVIKTYLSTSLGFDRDRVIAIGLGEMEIKDNSYVVGYEDNNRRVVFRLKSKI